MAAGGNGNAARLAIIGGGPGGYAAAFAAADLGLNVTLIDEDENPGGVCLYRGCIPSKALLHVAKVITDAREAESFGITYSKPKIDIDKLRKAKDDIVGKMTGGLGQLSKARGLTYIQGRATFTGSKKLHIERASGGEETLETDYTIVAAGSRPAMIPGLPEGSTRVLDSTTALDVASVPKTLLVIGGGYIGLELGSVYAALGTKVTVVEMLDGLLPGADRDLVKLLQNRLKGMFEDIKLKTKVTGVKEQKNGLKVTLEDENGESTDKVFEKVLVAVGRKPNTENLGLDKTKVQVGDDGFIQIDIQGKTDDEAIYAIGDVAGQPMLAHKASHEGRVAAEAIAGHKAAFEPNAIPAVVFTDPEIAWAGLTETEAKAKGQQVNVAKFPWGASGRATTLHRPEGVTKIICDPDSERVLGVGIAGTNAGEMIAEGVLAIEMGALAKDVAHSIHPHPTLSETVMESAEMIFGQSTHVYRPKKK